MITANSTLVDVAFAVSTALTEAGVNAVLTGGSAATFYAPHAYQSDDLDFVITLWGDGGTEALGTLGYTETRGFYRHCVSPYPVEFPKGPLMIGDDYVDTWATHHRGNESLNVLSPTDCCRDRLAAFLFWDDFAGLTQALAVAQAQQDDFDLDSVRDWCERERASKKFEIFASRLADLS